ncbi:MAG: hypothetical protein O7F76_03815, partial [Planctomycetota bacterium]|nr:hypothetical protein [Planctomycetota bacterium]
LDAADLAMWHDASAYFNGDQVTVELVAGPKTVNNRFVIEAVDTMYFRPQPVGGAGQCGICGSDGRVPSDEDWACRLFPAGCTASVYSADSCLVSAGHCIGGNMVVQFNVPNSAANCNLFSPPIADQFPASSFSFTNGGPGNDWSVLTTGNNNLGQMPFERYGVLRPISPSVAPVGTSSELTGFGADLTCVLNQTQQTADGPINQVFGNAYTFSIDLRGGNSGSSLIRNDTENIIGIATHCPCPNVATRIDLNAFENAIDAACPPEGACCATNGTCTVETNETCGGTFQGRGVTCGGGTCPASTGACCIFDGCLDTLSQTVCESNGGLYIGDGEPCLPDPCPQANGACCLSFGCVVLDEGICVGNGGEFQGDMAPCEPNPCEKPCVLIGDINGDGDINGTDIGGYNRAKLGAAPEPDENQVCADYGTGTIAGDNALFVADLLSN